MGLGALWADFKDDLFTYRTVKVRLYRARVLEEKRERMRDSAVSFFPRRGAFRITARLPLFPFFLSRHWRDQYPISSLFFNMSSFSARIFTRDGLE